MGVHGDSCGLQAAQGSKRVRHYYDFHSSALLRSEEEWSATRGALSLNCRKQVQRQEEKRYHELPSKCPEMAGHRLGTNI